MNAKVLSLVKKNNLLEVKLDQSIFYPGGGGQPCDTGFLENPDFLGEVVFARKEGKDIVHVVKPARGEIAIGTEVEMKINKKRREQLTKMHTAEHILFKSLQNIKKNLKLIKIDLDEFESSLFVEAKDLSFEEIAKAEEQANNIIAEGREIKEFKIKKTKAETLEGVRIKKERIKDEEVRIVEIEGFDKSACTGTHCISTNNVGHIIITNIKSYGPQQFEIRFRAGNIKDLLQITRYAREAAKILETNIEHIPKIIADLKKKVEEYKEQLRKSIQETTANVEEVHGYRVISQVFENADQKQIIKKGNAQVKEANIVVFINKKQGINHLLLFTQELNASLLLSNLLEKIPGKGGGKENFAMGGFQAEPSEILNLLKQILARERIKKE